MDVQFDESTIPKTVPVTKNWHMHPYPSISPTRPELSASGRNIVITGGGTGIGNAIAVGFAQAGAQSITILGRRLEKLEAGVNPIKNAIPAGKTTQIYHYAVDLVSREETEKVFQAIASQIPGGKIDVLVSNAGSLPIIAPAAKATDEQLLDSFTGQVVTAMHAIQAFIPLAGPDPIVLSTNTCIAHLPAIPGYALYAATRAAPARLTDYLQKENPGMRIISVHPGYISTEGNAYDSRATDSVPKKPIWLASPEAEFLKGKFVWSNWDVDELIEKADKIKNSPLMTFLLDGSDNNL
ncbi:putative short chain dehydrogenase reductase [Rhypophila decipiens]|uniref:Short chain dehydrogenase reductase n=1 Tax=Rhypophila decipiens TaxID=261697 RepID=A0AAN7B1V6_9PEZI|nr:putative short chain dehydrogenase reductase [Rhypophila decipiens]